MLPSPSILSIIVVMRYYALLEESPGEERASQLLFLIIRALKIFGVCCCPNGVLIVVSGWFWKWMALDENSQISQVIFFLYRNLSAINMNILFYTLFKSSYWNCDWDSSMLFHSCLLFFVLYAYLLCYTTITSNHYDMLLAYQ